MKLCIVGIGGAGGKVTSQFLENVDLNSDFISRATDAEYVCLGRINGIWLEADKDDAKNKQHFFKDLTEGGYPGFVIPHDVIKDGSDLHVRVKQKYGYNLKKQGFVRDAQYLKAIFEIFDADEEIQKIAANTINSNASIEFPIDSELSSNTDNNNATYKQPPNPIFDNAWNTIRDYTILGKGTCDGILFIVSLGGGTGTGFINPIIDHIRKEGKTDFPVFVLGILTESGNFVDAGQFSEQGQRYLAATSAIYDLLTKNNGANGIILVDNEMMGKLVGSDKDSINKFIYKFMRPIVLGRDYPEENPAGQAVGQNFSKGVSWPPIFVPLFWSQPRKANSEDELVSNALKNGRLFYCTPEKADKAIVFCRGFNDSMKIRKALSEQTGIKQDDIWVLRKLGEQENEILILLRNPYGHDPKSEKGPDLIAYKKEGTLENKFCQMISVTLKYMNEKVENLFYEGSESQKAAEIGEETAVKLTHLARQALEQYFFGKEGFIKDNFGKKEGFAFELREARNRLRIGQRPFFLKPLRIFKKDATRVNGEEHKPKPIDPDDIEIMMLIDKRINERLCTLGYTHHVSRESSEEKIMPTKHS